MSRRFAFWTLLVTAGLLLTACWDHTPLDESAFVVALGFDSGSEANNVRLTQVIVSPRGIDPEGQSVGVAGMASQTLSTEDPSLAVALSSVLRQVPYRLQTNHAELGVLHIDFARGGVSHLLEFLLRHPQMRPTLSLVVSREPAHEILDGTLILEPNATNIVRDLLTAPAPAGNFFEVPLYQFAAKVMSPRQDAILPLIARKDGASDGGATDFTIEGLAVFQGDRLVGTLEGDAAAGVAWVLGGAGTTIGIPHPGMEGRWVGIVVVQIERAVSAQIEEERLVIRIQVQAEGDVLETGELVPIAAGPWLDAMSRAAEHAIAEEIRTAMEQLQNELHADVFGVGEQLYRRSPQTWNSVAEQWDEVYAMADVEIDVTVHLRRTGLGR